MAIKLVAFDWNGTMISDTAACVRAENMALAAIGFSPLTITKFQQAFGIPIVKYFNRLGMTDAFIKKNLQTIEDVYHVNYEKFVKQARTRAGTKTTLRWLHAQKIERVIYSNHTISKIRSQLVRLKISHMIDVILAREDHDDETQLFERSKDKKLSAYAKKHKIKPHEIVSIGDSEEEIEIGKAGGYYTVAITGGWNSVARLKKHKPDFLIHNMKDIIKIIKKLNHD